VSQHFAEHITNQELAKACGLSVRAFERQFRATYQSSPHDYVRQMRVRMSCSALVFSKKSLAEVASGYGFADQSHFAKEFRRIMGDTPRRIPRALPALSPSGRGAGRVRSDIFSALATCSLRWCRPPATDFSACFLRLLLRRNSFGTTFSNTSTSVA